MALGPLTDPHAIRACVASSWQPQRRATLWAVCGTSLAVSAEAGLVPTRPEKVHLDRWQARLPIPIAPEGNRAMISPWHTRAERDATRLGAELGLVSVVQSRKCLLSETKRNDAWTDHFSEAGLQLAAPFPVHVHGWSAHVPVPIAAEGDPTPCLRQPAGGVGCDPAAAW